MTPNLVWNTTLSVENNKNSGRHSVLQVSKMLINKGMTNG
jgi:hypothetical protein